MKNAVLLEDRAFLCAIRGTFTETKKEEFNSLFYAYLFFIGIPAVIIICLFSNGWPHIPLSSDRWILGSIIFMSIASGAFIHRFTGFSYVFDGKTVRQIDRSGRLWKEIYIQDIVTITVDRSGGTKSMLLRSERSAMGVLLTPDLSREISRVANPARQDVSHNESN